MQLDIHLHSNPSLRNGTFMKTFVGPDFVNSNIILFQTSLTFLKSSENVHATRQ